MPDDDGRLKDLLAKDRSVSGAQTSAELQLDAIFRALPDLLFCMDHSGRILSYRAGNPSSLYLGPQDFLGKQIQALLPADISRKFVESLDQAVSTGSVVSMDYHLQVPDGKRWFEAHLVPSPGEQVIAIIRDVSERVQNASQLQHHLQRLSALHSIDAAITSSFDLKVILSVILRQITNQLGVDAADVLLLNELTHKLEYTAGLGFRSTTLPQTSVLVGQGFAGTAALQRRTVSVPILNEKQTGELFSPGLAREKFASYYAVPLIAKGQVRGVLEIFHRSILKPSDDWFEFLATLAGQTAVAIESASLFQDLQYSNMELSAAMDATIESWSQALEVSGREAPEHTQRVVHWCLQVAQEMHVDEKDLLDLRRGAFLHDIGKMSIPESILNKPAALDEAEWQLIHRHPLAAFNFLSQIKPLASAMDIPRYHHERWDGSGYPDGLKGRQIPLAARIFAVVDVFDSMTTARPFRQAQDRKAALEFIRAASGRLFDPQVVDAFSQIIWGYI